MRAGVAGKEILKGIDLTVRSGEVHAIMGPNGSGKSTLSHVIMGRPGYEVLGGTVTLDGIDLLGLAPWERAQAGLFLAMQYPTEVPGVAVVDVLEAAYAGLGRDPAGVADRILVEAGRIGFDDRILHRAMNVDLSGGEKKRNETLQLGVLEPAIAILDEIDSGLDVDALRACARRIEAATEETGLGVLAITHYSRLLHELRADHVHVLSDGVIQRSGGPELAAELERTGYAVDAPGAGDGGPIRSPTPSPTHSPDRGTGAEARQKPCFTRQFGWGLTYSPVRPSTASRRRSACPLWRAVSSIMWHRIQRRVNDLAALAAPGDGELVERVGRRYDRSAAFARLLRSAATSHSGVVIDRAGHLPVAVGIPVDVVERRRHRLDRRTAR